MDPVQCHDPPQPPLAGLCEDHRYVTLHAYRAASCCVRDLWNCCVIQVRLPLCSLSNVHLVCLELWKSKNTAWYVMKKDICLHSHELVWEGSSQHPALPGEAGEQMALWWRVGVPRPAHSPLLCAIVMPTLSSALVFKPDGITREEWRYLSESRVLCLLLVAPEFTFMEKSCQGCACHINSSSSCIMQSVCSSQMLKQLKTFKFSAKCTLRVIYTDCNVSCFN